MASGLQLPWQVKEVTFSPDELALSELSFTCVSVLHLTHAFQMNRTNSILYMISLSDRGSI